MDLDRLQDLLNYRFKNPELLREALTHPSYMIQASEGEQHNQRLEFLGDAVLELIVSEALYTTFPDLREGQLTQYRSTLVKSAALVQLASEMQLSEFLRVPEFEGANTTRNRPSAQEDAIEALIGAVYLDSDLATARDMVIRWYGDIQTRLKSLQTQHNPKGQLQELLQPDFGNNAIAYEVTQEEGPPHERTFTVELKIEDTVRAIGIGKSKKEAEEKAARQALSNLDDLELPKA